MARRLARSGARLVLVARSEEALARLAAELRAGGAEAHALAHDLQPPGAAQALAERVAAEGLSVDVLVNNAGYGIQGAFLDHTPADAEGMIGLNVTALTLLARLFGAGMVARGRGGLLQVASIAGFVPAPFFAVYAATKAYVRSFSDALHGELKGSGVHVTCLSPGPTATGFGGRAGMSARFFQRAQTAEAVAEAGLRGLARGEREVVSGAFNRVQAAAGALAPRSLAVRVAAEMMRRAGA